MATIRQRGSNWEAQIRRKGWPTLSRSFSTKADARAWATVIESEIERGVFIDRTEAEKNTLGDLIRRYLQEVSGQKKGAESERYRLTAMLRDPLAQVKVAALSGKLIAEWRDKRLKQVSGSTTNRDLNLISHVINVAGKEWGIHIDNAVSMVRRPAENRGRNRRLGHGNRNDSLPRSKRLHATQEVALLARVRIPVNVTADSGIVTADSALS
ncbi:MULTISPECIES: Shufflon-specific DNA recombinase [Cupriavidus]|uniref:Shufflon-specific DNA recombinase n=1 Tax=Cupriavidus oxalaticus TaxID=96344 RepID=A0A4P7LN29_9BURK|nr:MULTISPECIES: Shufflon-specific DNA recombinase [Cupriavidus]MBF6992264.1 Shufflon-specific DNA recombinase [Cupriavidus sp. IK-TO18]QBY53691.1 Shufflon-specific DNA recombinase [Cupriavidus oxalaticus]